MRSVHFINAYHEASGGIRTFYHQLAHAATASGRSMHLVVPGVADDEQRLGPVRISTVRAPRAPVVDRRYRLVLPHRFLIPNRDRIWRLLRENPPDVVEVADKFTWCYLGGLIKGLWRRTTTSAERERLPAGRPMVVGFSHERLDDNVRAHVGSHALARTFAASYMRRVYVPQCDAHLANSHYTLDEVTEVLGTTTRGSLAGRRISDVSRAVPLGVDATAWSPASRCSSTRARLTQGARRSDAIVLLYVGRLAKEKHVHVLPEVMSILASRDPRFHLVLVGSGPLEQDLSTQAQGLGNLHVIGQCTDRARLAALYASADLLLHPNPREPFGLAPLEAMASGLPVVVPDAGGVRAYVSDDNAWLALGSSPEALADTVQRAWLDVRVRAGRRAQALLTAQAHDWTRVTRAIFAQYDDLYARFIHYESAKGYARAKTLTA